METRERVKERLHLHLKNVEHHDHIEICRVFGCGRKLSLDEKLKGTTCSKH